MCKARKVEPQQCYRRHPSSARTNSPLVVPNRWFQMRVQLQSFVAVAMLTLTFCPTLTHQLPAEEHRNVLFFSLEAPHQQASLLPPTCSIDWFGSGVPARHRTALRGAQTGWRWQPDSDMEAEILPSLFGAGHSAQASSDRVGLGGFRSHPCVVTSHPPNIPSIDIPNQAEPCTSSGTHGATKPQNNTICCHKVKGAQMQRTSRLHGHSLQTVHECTERLASTRPILFWDKAVHHMVHSRQKGCLGRSQGARPELITTNAKIN